MPLGRRRPLMRAAMVGGGAYAAGRHHERGRQHEAGQEERIDQLEGQQQPPPPSAGGMSDAAIEQLQKLGQLRESGILTDAEFAAQKQKLLAG